MVEGPVSTNEGFYVFQVDTITEARTVPFEEARAQIDQQLSGQLQQEVFTAFLADYRDRWTQLTVCADDVLGERCENFTAEAEPCDTEAQEEQQAQLPEDQRTGVSCPAPVFAASGGAGLTAGRAGLDQGLHPRRRPAAALAPAGRGRHGRPAHGRPGGPGSRRRRDQRSALTPGPRRPEP